MTAVIFRRLLVAVCALAVLLPVAVRADADQGTAAAKQVAISAATDEQAPAAQTTTIAKKKISPRTGTYVPTRVRRVARTTNGAVPVTIIDQDDIRRSGAQNLAGVLARDPAIQIHVRGN